MMATPVEKLWTVLSGDDFDFLSGTWDTEEKASAEELKLKVMEGISELSIDGQKGLREVLVKGMHACTRSAERTEFCLALSALAIQGHEGIWEGSSVVGFVGKRMGIVSRGFDFFSDPAGNEDWEVEESRKCMLELLTVLPEQVFNSAIKNLDASSRETFRKRLMESFEDVLVAIEGCVNSLWGLGEALVPLTTWWELGDWSCQLEKCSRVHFLIRAALGALQESQSFAEELDRARPGRFRRFPSSHVGAGPSGNACSTTVSSPTSSRGAGSSSWDVQQETLSLEGRKSASSLYNGRQVLRIQLPPGYSIGNLIGAKGANIKFIQSRCPSRVSFDETKTEGVVLCKGRKDGVDAARSLLEKQFTFFRQSVGAYMLPTAFHFAFDKKSAIDGYTLNPFQNEEVTRAMDNSGPFYCVMPVRPEDMGSDAILSEAGCDGGSPQTLGTNTPIKSIFGATDIPMLFEKFVTAIEGVAPKARKDDRLKVKFNFGKQLFLPGRRNAQVPQEPMTMDGMNYLLQERENVKAGFTNAVTTKVCTQVEATLKEVMGFKQKESKSTVSGHIRHPASSATYSLSFFRKGKGSLRIRKVKYNSVKSQLLALMDPTSIDFRMKLVGQRRIKKGSSDENAACLNALAESGAFHLKNTRLVMACPKNRDKPFFLVDKCRNKKKTTYQGSFSWPSEFTAAESSITIQISINSVTSESRKTHNEITGSCVEINDLLDSYLQSDSPSEMTSKSKEMLRFLDGLAQFGREVKLAAQGYASSD